ncbi:hypothetical protein, partial [Mesorhizobium sp.]|uniref:hypothetical protein n=1 Tax=Mesorhizobium sp. TaxID=1871066 RepID=UPI0025C1E15C
AEMRQPDFGIAQRKKTLLRRRRRILASLHVRIMKRFTERQRSSPQSLRGDETASATGNSLPFARQCCVAKMRPKKVRLRTGPQNASTSEKPAYSNV